MNLVVATTPQLARAEYPLYVGIDAAESSISAAARALSVTPRKASFSPARWPRIWGRFDLVLSLDVIYHPVEDKVFWRLCAAESDCKAARVH
jgi:hypothetical protein